MIPTRTFVLGAVAGCGKTYTCVHNCRGSTLVVVPTNKRVEEFENTTFPPAVTATTIVTTAEFVGRNWSQSMSNQATIDLSAFDTIMIDEFYQSSVAEIIRMISMLESETKPDAMLMANGDTHQLTNHEPWPRFQKADRKQEYVDQFLWRVFPNRLVLNTSRRLKSEADRTKMMGMLKALQQGNRPLDVMRMYGLNDNIITDVEQARNKLCIVRTNLYGNVLNQRFGGPDTVGMTVIPKETYLMRKVKGEDKIMRKEGFRTNKAYTVEALDNNKYSLRHAPTAEPQWLPRKFFRRNIAWTCHAVQGETVTEPYVIFEAEDSTDWRWFYVAISRTDNLSKVFVYAGEPLVDTLGLKAVIRRKIASHAQYDKENKYATNVTEQWVLDELKKNNYKCAHPDCYGDLLLEWDKEDDQGQFSIDRKDPDQGHTKENCRITHLSCNKRTAFEGKESTT